ncbi:hypothetical protein [Bradyrhizobium sp.]|jgi:hypothetical protein|uniref:hypothetical protein n=1 Tax=Bradyrhizobium sp. TaxID=376 RepID=UPI002E08EED5|nr:hypothetical protein [Bradyrhizobium sp.]
MYERRLQSKFRLAKLGRLVESFCQGAKLVILVACISFVVVESRPALAAENFPDSERIFSALSACALNVDLKVDANIAGSLRSVFSSAAAQGRFSVSTTTSFLQLFPESDKLKAYRAYRYCMFTTLKISPDSICDKPKPSQFTRAALGRFTVSGQSLVNREDILSAMLEGLLRKSRRYSVVLSENNLQAMEKLADADQLMSISMTNDTIDCNRRAEEAFLPTAAAIGDAVVINVRIVDVSSGKLLRGFQVQGGMGAPQELDTLITMVWRGIEQGLAPEAWVWRGGVGYCEKLNALLADAPSASCTSDEGMRLMQDQKTNNNFIDNCQSIWRRNQMEPVCMFTCSQGRVTDLRLYKRLQATSLTSAPRSASEQRAFINRLKTNFGYTDEKLAAVNIKPIYPDEDLSDPETIFNSAARDISACLTSWRVGKVVSGNVEGVHSDQGSKNVTFSNGNRKVILDLDRWSDGQVRWNYIGALIR